MEKKRAEYIVIRGGFWRGVVGDVFMYGILLVMYWFNYNHLGNNGVLNVLFTVLVVMFITNLFATKYKHTFYSYEELQEYLAKVADPVGSTTASAKDKASEN